MSEVTGNEVNVEEVTTEETVTEEVKEVVTDETKASKDKGKKAKKEKTKKKSWFKGLVSEFKRISWPDRKKLGKQIVAVIGCSVLLGVIIMVVDVLLQYVIKFLIG